MRGEHPVVEDRVAQPRPQGHDHLVPVAGDDPAAGDFGVVEDERGDCQTGADGAAHVEAGPLLDQLGQDPRARAVPRDVVRGGDDHSVTDHPGHAHCDAVGSGQLLGQTRDRLDELGGR